MTAIVLVENREAIPVRAIPFVTGWKMSPDKVAWSFAHLDDAETLEGVTAKHLLENGQVADVLPKEWDRIIADIEALTETLKEDGILPRKNRPTWERKSIRCLPAQCFVWRDEFEAAFRRAYSPRRRVLLDMRRGDRGERAGERELNFAPLIPDQATVFQGFPAAVGKDGARPPTPSDSLPSFGEVQRLQELQYEEYCETKEGQRYWHIQKELLEIEQAISEVERLPAKVPSERKSKQRQLAELRKRRQDCEAELRGEHTMSQDHRPDQVKSGRPLDVFLAMKRLTADEVTIAFVGEKTDSGLGANNMLEISARNETKHVALAEVGLADRRRGTLNGLAAILVAMAQKKTLPRTDASARKMTRLREVFRKHFGIEDDPFETYRKVAGWVPRFKITDKRGAADERAKISAKRRTESYEPDIHDQSADNGQDQPFDDEDDAAGEFIKNHSRNASA